MSKKEFSTVIGRVFEAALRARSSWSPTVVFAAALCLCVLGVGLQSCAPRPKGQTSAPDSPNVVLITVDTLRADHLGCYGYAKNTSPAIDKLASQGIRFDWAFAQRSVTWPSLASLMTSLYPSGHGVRYNGMLLSDTHTPIPEVLASKGYRCAAFVSIHLKGQLWEGFKTVEFGSDTEITAAATRWLADREGGPFFLWLHYYAPHTPYEPPEPFAERFTVDYDGPYTGARSWTDAITLQPRSLDEEELAYIRSLYDGEVAAVDHEVGMVVDTLEGLGISSDTLVVLTADHGEDLYDHNRYFYHQASIYDSSLRIPLIMRLPETIDEGRVATTIVESIDIAPTVLELFGFDVPEAFQGNSFVPILQGHDIDLGPAFAEEDDKIVTIRTAEWRYVLNPSGFNPTWISKQSVVRLKNQPFYNDWVAREAIDESKWVLHYFIDDQELYRHADDPQEQQNVVQKYGKAVPALKASIIEWQERYGWKTFDNSSGVLEDLVSSIDAETLEQLEGLGYVF